ncbi:uncharacterized protein KY384_004201 [Bacidia gigantensis]|uniref:uncharacterized protein n=1 Tax=Bacidia gigantensis TaxID=2732470 RepID=UPI001D0491C5|nr:uncharacterized protein KY384_004201 [Bacidia gigantensis]KAG8530844.1 hypothetical protein KY384_004201 [Bacidia gigantensis]
MVQYIPPPDPRSLLPPLLACLPISFVSPRPPPALLPLLSPILQQRLQLLATSTSPSGSWLPLLCWDAELAQQVVDIVSDSDVFELHPTSGEIEIGSVEPLRYKRLDEETLQCRIAAPDTGLAVITLWYAPNQDGESNTWRIAEVRPLHDNVDAGQEDWSPSMTEAEERCREKAFDEAIEKDQRGGQLRVQGAPNLAATDEDDYWSQYDKTPHRTPGPGPGPQVEAREGSRQNGHTRTMSEADYFQRYAGIQPDMDSDDPSQDREAFGDSTLHGNALSASYGNESTNTEQSAPQLERSLNEPPLTISTHPTVALQRFDSNTVPRLESSADKQSEATPMIRQHVSTSIKSLYRLCQGSGMDRSEFGDLVRTELETLSIVDDMS